MNKIDGLENATFMKILFTVVMLLWASNVPAAGTNTLTWEQCVEKINRQAPMELIAAVYATESAEALSRAAEAEGWPRLSVSSGIGVLRHRPDIGKEETTGGYIFGVSGTWPVFPRLDLAGKKQAATADVMSQKAHEDKIKTDVTLLLQTAFYELLFAQQELPLTQMIVDRRSDHLNTVSLRYHAGRETKAALLMMQAALSEAKMNALTAQQNLHLTRKKLARLLSIPESDPITVDGSFPTNAPQTPSPLPDVQSTPENRIAEAELVRAEAEILSARSAIFPKLEAVASLNPQSDSWSNNDHLWFAGIWVKYTFFSGGSDWHKLTAAKYNRNRAEAQRKSVMQLSTAAAEQAQKDYSEAVLHSALQRETLNASELRAEIARVEYQRGALSFSNWELIEMDLIQKQRNALKSRLHCALARARWLHVTGNHVFTLTDTDKKRKDNIEK